MEHLDDDTLVLIALVELEPSDEEREHLTACSECGRTLAELRKTVDLGRSARTVELVGPDDVVWEHIHTSLGLSEDVASAPRRADFRADAGHSTGATDAAVLLDGADLAPPAPVASIDRARTPRGVRSWWPIAAAAAILGLVGGLAAGIWWQSGRDSEATAVLAEAELDPFPGWEATGVARVEERADGRREVVIDLDAPADTAELREVWLIKSDASGLVSIGLLDGSSGRFTVPAGLDLAQYPLVDVSAEPDNGDPTHSGDSIVRGELHSS